MNKKLKFLEGVHTGSLEKSKGITLVALIITIIILLILAGITISQLTESGLFEKAKLSKEKQENAEIKEDKTLLEYENEISKNINNVRDESQNSGIQDTVLWTGSISKVGETATLSDSIENYKYILLEVKWKATNAFYDTWLNVSTIKDIGYFANNYSSTNSHALISMYYDHYMYITFTSSNSIVIPEIDNIANMDSQLTKVIGVK